MNNLSSAINLIDYNITYTDFVQWVLENKMDVYAVNAQGGNGGKIYFFQDLEDFTAFTLKFSKRFRILVSPGVFVTVTDISTYISPNEKSND